ncbi:organomercurial lyase MerB [Haloechinothrix sp. YIM 98757]|uniref:Alkylmercury lyase n=1 Tax=Haloechinothrix aidingensis TaxID=2752311 RepID=A0A838AEM6_9PSEU|nr:organomercurial lyase MerB [Haloechinothrix aidingensis]MBA0127661.1 organomercurial lyase MerB [Haloechinothrix aidingensis]
MTDEYLADRLSETLRPNLTDPELSWLWSPLLRLLAGGSPVPVARLAAATGRTEPDVRRALARLSDTEYDEHGRIVGWGLTQRPTPHSFIVDGVALYTWCALDTLIFPAVLDRTARVESPCRATGAPVRLTVTPAGISDVEPATAVLSIVAPQAQSSVRTAFCDQVHFFAEPASAQDWNREHPEASVLPVAEAHTLAQRLSRPLRDACA